MTRDHTVPTLILSNDANHRKALLEDIANATGQTIQQMLNYETFVLANVVARLYMEEDSVRDRGVKVFEQESESDIRVLLAAGQVPIVFALALELGDEDVEVQHKVSQ